MSRRDKGQEVEENSSPIPNSLLPIPHSELNKKPAEAGVSTQQNYKQSTLAFTALADISHFGF
ncbi:MAG: hypothetical protein KAF91_19810 [Nostoc sp. TH1S01]|nr:hypothetical protein [Nostoc sp. TH1S01]